MLYWRPVHDRWFFCDFDQVRAGRRHASSARYASDGVGKDCEKFLSELPPTPIFEDNKGTWATVNNPVSTAQASKALDVRYFNTRDYIREGKLRVSFLRTHLNVADFFTKGLPKEAFCDFKRVLMGSISHNH